MVHPRVIAFVTPLRVNYDRKVVEGVARYVAQHPGLELRLLCPLAGFGPVQARGHLGVDGAIGIFADAPELACWKRRRIPVINVGAFLPTLPRAHVDDLQMGELAARHFLEHGHQRFLYVSCHPYSPEGSCGMRRQSVFDRERLGGFRRILRQAGRDTETLVLDGRRLFAEGSWHEVLEELAGELRRRPKPLAVFAMADTLGRLVLQACRQAGLAVPDEVAVVGVDNDELFCLSASPPLSSVAQGEERLGWEAARLLDRILKGEAAPKSVIRLDPLGLVERDSSTADAGDPAVAQAMAHIRRNLQGKIDRDELAGRLNLSRRTFERKTAKALGSSPGKIVRQLRLEKARHLLLNTTMRLKDVYAACGFASPEHFHRTFKRHFGLPPLAYRRQNRQGGG